MATAITLTDRLIRNRNLLGAELDAQFVLLSLEAGNYYGLDKIGSDIWRMLEHETSAAELCKTLGARFRDTPAEVIQKDVLVFLERLQKHNLIVVTPAAG